MAGRTMETLSNDRMLGIQVNIDPLETGIGHDFRLVFVEDLRTYRQGPGQPLGTGINPIGSNHYQGFLDDVMIYHKALTALKFH